MDVAIPQELSVLSPLFGVKLMALKIEVEQMVNKVDRATFGDIPSPSNASMHACPWTQDGVEVNMILHDPFDSSTPLLGDEITPNEISRDQCNVEGVITGYMFSHISVEESEITPTTFISMNRS